MKHTARWKSALSECFQFLRATARTAKRVLAMVILYVRLSRPGTDSSPGEIETPGFHRMIVYSL